MPSTSRRRALQACGTALAAGVTGCSTLTGEQSAETPRLGRLTVSNFHDEPHAVHVLLLDDDEPRYWRTRRVPAGDADDPAGVAFEGYPTDPGEYVLQARVDDRPVGAARRLDFGEFDAGCLGLLLQVGEHQSPASTELSIWHTTNPNECGDG